ncbi:MAG: cell filamentation protein Fic [Clostridiales bacterium]|nr:MAG: cell filamentation protein Fic [Clostridiales bacterium]
MSLYEKIDQYKAILDEKRPFEPPVLKQLQDYYRIGLTYSSNALEGNTLTISETKVLLEDGLTANGKPLKDTFEALGHAKAYDFMFSLLRRHEITEQDVLTLHRLFYTGIDDAQAGRYRTEPVFITGSSFPVCEAEQIRTEMAGLFRWIDSKRGCYHPVEFAAELHKRLVFIHPFIDGNGRVARLLMNTALIQDGYMIVTIPPVLRMEYIGLLEKAHTDATDFINFIAEQELESEKDMMRLLHLLRS